LASPATLARVTRLFTFAISHFSEKARWALDLGAVPYTERRLLPGAHIPTIRRRAPRTSVPVLEHDGEIVQGSGQILDHLERRLGVSRLAPPAGAEARCAEIEALADRAFGLGTQRIFYATLLDERSTVVDMWSQHGPAWGRAFYTLAFPFVSRAVRRMYKTVPDKVAESKDLFRRAFDELDATLAGEPYLLGDALSRADVTVAALLAPLCRPPEHMLRWPETNPPALDAFVSEFEDRPTWAFVRRMYREHRGRRAS
jgi:glutathione S-transferase